MAALPTGTCLAGVAALEHGAAKTDEGDAAEALHELIEYLHACMYELKYFTCRKYEYGRRAHLRTNRSEYATRRLGI